MCSSLVPFWDLKTALRDAVKSKGILRQNLDLEVAVSGSHLLLHVDPLQVVGVEGEPGLGGGRGEARVGAGVPLQRGPLGVPGAATVLDMAS